MLIFYLHILPYVDRKKKEAKKMYEKYKRHTYIHTSPTHKEEEEEKNSPPKVHKIELMNTKKKFAKEKRNRTIRNKDVIVMYCCQFC